MQLSISDSMMSDFASGLFAVFALIGVGAALMLILSGLGRKFPFTRLSLVLALTPFSLIRFLERDAISSLFLYAMIAVLLGITIDGITHMLMPKSQAKKSDPEIKHASNAKKEEPVPGMIVWEKAE